VVLVVQCCVFAFAVVAVGHASCLCMLVVDMTERGRGTEHLRRRFAHFLQAPELNPRGKKPISPRLTRRARYCYCCSTTRSLLAAPNIRRLFSPGIRMSMRLLRGRFAPAVGSGSSRTGCLSHPGTRDVVDWSAHSEEEEEGWCECECDCNRKCSTSA